MARAAMTAVCCSRIDKLPGRPNAGSIAVNTTTDSTRMTAGLIAGWECSRCCTR